MQMTTDLRVFELLASRLCHDVVGPVGAINNGMEFLEEEDDPGSVNEAVQLVRASARQAANILQFYRMAYGMAGSQIGADLSELADLARRRFEHTKVEVRWQDRSIPEGTKRDFGKMLVNIVALAAECLPRGGRVTVGIEAEEGAVLARVAAEGEGCVMRQDSVAALADGADITELTPRNVQGYFTKLLIRRLGSELLIDGGEDNKLVFLVRI